MKKNLEEIMSNFDFDKVHKTFCATELKWEFENGELRIPSVDEIKNLAIKMLKDAYKEHSDITCKGLEAVWNDEYLILRFVVAESYSNAYPKLNKFTNPAEVANPLH